MTSILIQIKDETKSNDVIRFLKDIDFLDVIVQPDSIEKNIRSQKQKLNDAFGIWADKDITLSGLRSKAWR